MPKECSSSCDAFESGLKPTAGRRVELGDGHLNDVLNPDSSAPEAGGIKREQFWTVGQGPGKTTTFEKNAQVGAYFKGPRVTSETHKTVNNHNFG